MEKKVKISIRKKILIGLGFSLLFNILALLIWFRLYIKPAIENYNIHTKQLKKQIVDTSYYSVQELKDFLEVNDIKYFIHDLNNKTVFSTETEELHTTFLNELLTIDNDVVFVKGYLENKLSSTQVIWSFLKIQLVLELIKIIILYLWSDIEIVKPIKKIINDMKNYKYGKKPIRNKELSEIDTIQNEFVSLTEVLDKNNEDKNRIIASISHDIKTPLTSIIGYGELLNDETDLGKIKKYQEKIRLKAENIKEITNNFDEYLVNNIENDLKHEDISIKDIVKLIDTNYSAELEANGIEFLIKSNCDKEILNLNISKFKRIFSNLISNSVRYLKAKGFIHIEITKKNDLINFRVIDNGTGVKKEILDKIFDPLYTTDSSRKISGLGLSIVKEIVLYHDGNIKAYNNEFGGLTIEFNIPKKQV